MATAAALPKLPAKALTAAEKAAGYERARDLLRRTALDADAWAGFVAGTASEPRRRQVLLGLERAAATRVGAITARLLAGEIGRDLWQRQMRETLIPLHYAAALAARGETGVALGAAARKVIEARIRRQLGFLERFKGDIALRRPGPWVAQRAQLYAGAVWATGQESRREQARGGGSTQERAVISPGKNCESCLDRAAQGWQPIGTLLPIGTGHCRTNCRCSFRFRGRGGA